MKKKSPSVPLLRLWLEFLKTEAGLAPAESTETRWLLAQLQERAQQYQHVLSAVHVNPQAIDDAAAIYLLWAQAALQAGDAVAAKSILLTGTARAGTAQLWLYRLRLEMASGATTDAVDDLFADALQRLSTEAVGSFADKDDR